MPFNTTPEIDFSAIGLITDVPPHSLPPGSWSDCLNLRCKDDSVQGVFDFKASNLALHDSDTIISGGKVKAITQFNESGSNDLIIAYIVEGTGSKGHVVIYDTVNATWNDVTSSVSDHEFTFDSDHKPQIFVFNGCLVVNPATDSPPLWCDASVSAGSLVEIPDWFNDYYVSTGIPEVQTITLSGTPVAGSYTSFLSQTDNGDEDLEVSTNDTLANIATKLANSIGNTATASGEVITVSFSSSLGSVTAYTATVGTSGLTVAVSTVTEGIAPSGTPLVARILRPFGNRLVAMNIKEEKDPAITTDDTFLPIDFLWSGNIKSQGTLIGLEWATSSINTAGDSFLTQTPGKIVDGMQLGPYFMAYKEDAVIQVYETGNSFVLGFRSVFEDDGLFSSGCVASIGNSQHLVIGNYGVYIHDGQTQKQHVAKGIFKDFLYKSVNQAHKNRSFVFQQTRDKEIWFCFSSTSNTNAGCNLALSYDFESKKLHKRTLPDITDLYEAELDGVLEIYGASDGGIKTLSESEYVSSGFFERRNETMGSNNFKTITGCNIKAEGGITISTASNKNINDVETYSNQVFDPDSNYKVNFRENGRFLSIKVTMVDDSNGDAVNPKLTTISFDMKETSRR